MVKKSHGYELTSLQLESRLLRVVMAEGLPHSVRVAAADASELLS